MSTTSVNPVISQPAPAESIMDLSVCLVLSFEKLGNSRKMPTQSVTVDSEPERIRVSKRLLDSKELAAIGTLDGQIRSYVDAQSLPSNMFKGGTFLVPLGKVEKVVARLEQFREERLVAIKTFKAAYPRLMEEAKEALRSNFIEAEYPDIADLDKMFGLEWQLVTYATPSSLKKIKGDIFQKETEKAQAKITAATEEIIDGIRVSFKKLVDHAVEKLAPSEDGKKKRFHASTIDNIKEFIADLETTNILKDKQLEDLANQARKLVDGVDPEDLRKEEGLRDSIANGLAGIQQSLESMIVSKPKRAITLEAPQPVALSEFDGSTVNPIAKARFDEMMNTQDGIKDLFSL